MKSASCARRVKQMSHGTADNRADNTEHDRPGDREMRVHEGLSDTSRKKADKDIPNEVKHIFLLLTSAIWKSTRSDSKIADRKPGKKK
jgi:hypothetical protein